MTTNNKIKIAIVILLLSTLLLPYLAYKNFQNSQNSYLKSLANNWSLGPIIDIEAVKGECPSGKTNLLTDIWQGTYPGCFCSGGLVPELKSGYCTDETSCSDVSELHPIKIRHWKGFNLCVKRLANYFELKIAKAPNACSADHKSCGLIDSLGNFLCLPVKLKCPYNYIKIMKNNLENVSINNETTNNFDNYKQKEFSKEKNNFENEIILLNETGKQEKLIFGYSENLVNKKIINEFVIEDNIPCMDLEQRSLNIKPYYLEKTKESKGCTNKIGDLAVDESFTKIDEESYYQLYSENKILDFLKKLPLFEAESNYLQKQTSLWVKSFIGINPKCIENLLQSESATEFLDKLSRSYQSLFQLRNLTLIANFISIFTVFLWLLLQGKKFVDDKNIIPDSEYFYNNSHEIFLTFIPSLIMSVILIINYTPISFELSILIEPECMDNITNIAFGVLAEKIFKGNFFILLYLLSSVLGIILSLYLVFKKK